MSLNWLRKVPARRNGKINFHYVSPQRKQGPLFHGLACAAGSIVGDVTVGQEVAITLTTSFTRHHHRTQHAMSQIMQGVHACGVSGLTNLRRL